MKYLIVDDIPESLSLLIRTLRQAGHYVTTARDLDIGWELVWDKRETPFDLVVLDLSLDRISREFIQEQSIIRNAPSMRDHRDFLPISGQAMGLRLWRRRKELRQRYCYLTHHRYFWAPQIDERDPEFERKASEWEPSAGFPDLILEMAE
uniref:Response regulator receiver domain-containing protein n=1 Tax=Candidatus Kentrum sp. UNK TaxID=2126344 RepID=A0A451AE55_9GAMM|nr:MAG: Response regulator receiver domain-containing protein [Candidatus Kentron sp. UNK]VFK71054.1 MAG: Response regulator receiver domain-containing protein [Candidatus Kentron sp. UNK]